MANYRFPRPRTLVSTMVTTDLVNDLRQEAIRLGCTQQFLIEQAISRQVALLRAERPDHRQKAA